MRTVRASQIGFTLLEMLVVIAIAAVLTGIAIPSFRTMIENAQRREASTSFYAALQRARAEAIARNTPVLVCARDLSTLTPPTCASAGSTAWQNGWIVFAAATPDQMLLVHEPLADRFTLNGVASPLTFRETGRVQTRADYNLCRGAGDTRSRRISVSRSGSISVESDFAGICP